MTDRSYIVTAKSTKNVNDIVADIQSLAEKKQAAVNIGEKYEIIGVLQMSCKADFAAAVRGLPSVLGVEEEGINYTQKKNSPKI